MSNQSRPSAAATNPDTNHHHGTRASSAFDRGEWEFLVTLPRRVLLAAVAAAPADGRQAAEGIAGIEAIAAGLASTSALVREAVSAIYSEDYPEAPASGDGPEVLTVQTLAACRYAAQLLAERCGPRDTHAYREWLLHIAAAATGVTARAPVAVSAPGTAGPYGPAQPRFLYALDGVLRP